MGQEASRDETSRDLISEWVDANFPRTYVYDDEQVNVMEEALPF